MSSDTIVKRCCYSYLPASGDSSDINPLFVACVNGHLEIADYLISKSICDVKGKTCESTLCHYTELS